MFFYMMICLYWRQICLKDELIRANWNNEQHNKSHGQGKLQLCGSQCVTKLWGANQIVPPGGQPLQRPLCGKHDTICRTWGMSDVNFQQFYANKQATNLAIKTYIYHGNRTEYGLYCCEQANLLLFVLTLWNLRSWDSFQGRKVELCFVVFSCSTMNRQMWVLLKPQSVNYKGHMPAMAGTLHRCRGDRGRQM